jgi:DNA-binding PadR family transcriptional regulator
VRLDHRGWIKGTWRRTEPGREAKYYALTAAGARALAARTATGRRLSGFLDRLLVDEG